MLQQMLASMVSLIVGTRASEGNEGVSDLASDEAGGDEWGSLRSC